MLETCPLCARLTADNEATVARLGASLLVLDETQRYPFKATLIADRHVTSDAMEEAGEDYLLALHRDVLRASLAVKRASGAARVNLAMFANMARHVHWHLVPREEAALEAPDVTGDAAFHAAPETVRARVAALRSALGEVLGEAVPS